MKKINWPFWAGTGTFLLLVVAACYIATTRMSGAANGKLTCDATTVRENGLRQWEKTMAPAKTVPPVDMRFFDGLTSTTSYDKSSRYSRHKIEFKFHTSSQPLSRSDVLYTIAPPENAANLTSPSLATLLTLGMEREESFEKTGGGSRNTDMMQFFLPNGTAITTGEFRKIVGGDRNFGSFYSQDRVSEREFQMIFQLDESRNAKLMDCQLWDNKTRYCYTSGWGMSGGKNGLVSMDQHGPFWRDTKVDIVIDVAYGNTIDRPLAPEVGATADFGLASVRVLSVLKDRSSNGYGTSGSNSDREVRLSLRETTGTTLLLLGVSPQCMITLFDAAIYFKGVKKPQISSLYSRDTFAMISITKPMEKVKNIELRLRTQVERKVITLDHLPGISTINAGKTDLLDLVLPTASFKQRYELERCVEKMLMLSNRHTSGFSYGSAKWPLPTTMKEPTVRDILDFYMQAYPGAECVIDEREGKLTIRKPLTFGDKMEEMFDNIGRAFTGRP